MLFKENSIHGMLVMHKNYPFLQVRLILTLLTSKERLKKQIRIKVFVPDMRLSLISRNRLRLLTSFQSS